MSAAERDRWDQGNKFIEKQGGGGGGWNPDIEKVSCNLMRNMKKGRIEEGPRGQKYI